jgi:hypothetical protein
LLRNWQLSLQSNEEIKSDSEVAGEPLRKSMNVEEIFTYKVPMTTDKLTHPITSATLQQFSSSWHEESENPVDNEKSSIVDISM